MGGQLHHRVEHRVYVLRGVFRPGLLLQRGCGEERDSSASILRCCSKYPEGVGEQSLVVGEASPKS
jgi:hypothetical protein